jgi:hypothetical protein
MANGILQPAQGSPFRPNVGAETIQGISNILQQFQAGRQLAEQRDQQQQVFQEERQSQILRDLLTQAQTQKAQADAFSTLNPQPKPRSFADQINEQKFGLFRIIVDPNSTPEQKSQAQEQLKTFSSPTTQVNIGGDAQLDAEKSGKLAETFQAKVDELNQKDPDSDTEFVVANTPKGPVITSKPKAGAGEGSQKLFSDVISLRDSAVNAQILFDKDFVGFIQGGDILGGIERATGLFTEPSEVVFKRIVRDLSDRLLRARSGAQINEQEFKRLTKIVPQLDTSDDVFQAELQNFIDEMNSIIKTKEGISRQAGKRGLKDPTEITSPKTKKEFDAIPVGQIFIDTDGKRKVKQ